MTLRMMPALLGAALLLAACGSGSENTSGTASPQDMSANAAQGTNAANGTGTNGGIDVSNLSTAEAQKVLADTVGDTVHFDTDSYSLNAAAQAELQKQAAWLKGNPSRAVTIEGHADERGTREYNLALGERRAQTIVNYLTALGIDAGRLSEISYGKERPICPDSTESCWAQNRRGVTTLTN